MTMTREEVKRLGWSLVWCLFAWILFSAPLEDVSKFFSDSWVFWYDILKEPMVILTGFTFWKKRSLDEIDETGKGYGFIIYIIAILTALFWGRVGFIIGVSLLGEETSYSTLIMICSFFCGFVWGIFLGDILFYFIENENKTEKVDEKGFERMNKHSPDEVEARGDLSQM